MSIDFFGPKLGLIADYWWEAQNWQTVMDIYENQKSEEYLKLIDDVYAGFVEH